jgi:prepilin-type N-terminal cleavage/methylation domain-containing protein
MQRIRKKPGQRGFTLIEVIIAGAIISIAMLGIIPLLIGSYRIDTQTTYAVRAQYSVVQRLDELIAQDSLTCDGVVNTDFVDASTGQVYAAAPPLPVVITRTWTVGAPAPPSNLCLITVTSTYTDKNGAKTLTARSQKGR